jgi:structural maintenance of chromosome 3 (chondroitin sulfate proteoglycan 6)
MNENFGEIFASIVPGGIARLKLVTTDVAKESQKSDPSQFPDGTQVFRLAAKSYKGIKVSVAFDRDAEETNLKQLSGGQKSVVVVAMIFAVLKMEAAPFYILDEFDHALDS